MEHRVKIVSQDREYSNVDAIHQHAMLSTRNEGRFTEKHAGIKKKKDMNWEMKLILHNKFVTCT